MILMELERIWKKKAYLLMVFTVIVLQIFILWYSDIYSENDVPLSGHRKLNEELATMSEQEKVKYLTKEKELMDAMLFEEKSQMYLSQDTELGKAYQEKVLEKNMDYYNEYLELYTSGDYLKYTDNLEDESALIYGACEEVEKVYGYADYIEEVSTSQYKLSQISIFESHEKSDSFSEKNIEKSAKDHKGMDNIKTRYFSAKGIEEAFKFSVTDIFIMLLVVYFSMQLVWEEKETGLFAVTRATKRGRGYNIAVKLMSLTIHVIITAVMLYLVQYIWYGVNAGFIDLTMPIQSVAAFMESSLRWNLLEMTAAVLFSKIFASFLIGLVVLFFALIAKMVWVPWLAATTFIAAGVGCYELIDIHSALAVLKYIPFFGLFQGGKLYGRYINVNMFGSPVSGMWICLLSNIILAVVLLVASIIVFLYFFEANLESHKGKVLQIKPLGRTLFNQEMYKIFVMNKAFLVVIIFLISMGYIQYNTDYKLPVGEIYYQNIMLELEGPLDERKEKRIETEQKRYDDAFEQIAKIEALEAEGKISEFKADGMKSKYEMIVSLYPQFEKVLVHYDRAKKENVPFLYDTGYRQLFGMNGGLDRLVQELLIAAITIILAFGSVLSMEGEKKSWMLLGTTYVGKGNIIKIKWLICFICAFVISTYSWIFRLIMINSKYPIGEVFYSAKCILGYNGYGVPLILFMLLEIVIHIILYMGMIAIVLAISAKREKTVEVYIFSTILLIVPFVLILLMRLDF